MAGNSTSKYPIANYSSLSNFLKSPHIHSPGEKISGNLNWAKSMVKMWATEIAPYDKNQWLLFTPADYVKDIELTGAQKASRIPWATYAPVDKYKIRTP